jgi:hypothetical protein
LPVLANVLAGNRVALKVNQGTGLLSLLITSLAETPGDDPL